MLAVTVATWLGLDGGLEAAARYWDGPLYLYVAQTFYAVPVDHPFTSYGLQPSYLALYFPLYPALIRAFAPLFGGSLPHAMLFVTAASSCLAAVLFHRLLCVKGVVASPLWTALFFAVLPPRWLVYHAIGATEPLFLCCMFAALLADERGRSGEVALWIALASLSRISGVLLGPVFALLWLERRNWRGLLWLPLAGLGILGLFWVYELRFGDFFAYFRWQGHHLRALPFTLYADSASHPSDWGTEFLYWTYLLHAVGTLALWRHRELFWCAAVYTVFGLFLHIDDVARMFVPAAPFALLVAFDPLLRLRQVRALLPLLALGGMVYAWGFIPHNSVDDETWRKLTHPEATTGPASEHNDGVGKSAASEPNRAKEELP